MIRLLPQLYGQRVWDDYDDSVHDQWHGKFVDIAANTQEWYSVNIHSHGDGWTDTSKGYATV
jgi:hypothetical protein